MSRIPPQMPTREDVGSILSRPAVAAMRLAPGHNPVWMLALAALLLAATGAQAQFSTPVPVGATSGAQTVTVTAQVAGTVNKVEVLTLGASGLDFASGGGAACGTPTLAAGATCQQSVTFTPAYPGLRLGAVVLLDVNGNVLGTAYLSGIGQGGLDVLTPGNVIEFAGVLKQVVSTKNNIPATQANLKQPAGVALDGAGNVYIADSAHNEVRMVCFSATSATISGFTCPGPGIIIDIAGTGDAGYTGDGGPASSSNVTLNAPSGLGLDGAGNLYIADTGNAVIRKITAATGIITTVVGDGTAGYGGDGLKATAAGVELNSPWGVTPDAAGNLFIADTANQRIRRVDAVTDIITTAAGNGDASGLGDGKGTYSGDGGPAIKAGLSLPYAVAFDINGDMFIPDSANNRIRAVQAVNGAITASSVISTAAGTGTASSTCLNGPTNATALNSPEGVALDPASNLYISDTGDLCVRKANVTSGQMVTLSVTFDYAVTLAGVPALDEVFEPIGIIVDGLGNVFYADYYFMLIDEIQSDKAVLNWVATPVREGDQSATQIQVVENDGNASSNLTAITPDANAAVDPAATTCTPTPFALAQDADCNIGAIFAPSVAGDPLLGNIDITDNTVNSPLDIVLIGDATAVNSTTTTLTSSLNPSLFGQSVTFTATVTTGPNTGVLTGTVTFSDTFNGNTVTLGAPVGLNGAGAATYTTAALAVGVHQITASYGGDATHFDSTSAPLAQTVLEATSTSLVSSLNPSAVGQNVTFTATVAISGGGGVTPDGTVTFSKSGTVLGTVALGTNGVATYSTAALPQGVNAISATYSGDPNSEIQGSFSAVLNQDVQATSTIAVTSSLNPSTYGVSVTFTATVTPNGTAAATGAVNFLDGGKQIGTGNLAGTTNQATFTTAALAEGSHSITVAYQGDSNYAPASSSPPLVQVVNQAQTSTSVVAVPNPGIAGEPVAITATVMLTAGVATPTGTVTFTDTFNGATVTLGAPTLSGTGTATVNPTLAPGTHSIVATYSGDANDSGSASAPYALTVNLATTSAVVTATPNPAIVQTPITFTAKVTGNGGTPTGSVNFLANGTIALGTANLDATGTATVTSSGLAAGSYQITAVYAGDTNDAGATSPAITEVVGTIPTITDLGASTTTGASPQVILVATVLNNATTSGSAGAPPTGTITFNSGSTVIGTATLDSSGVATLVPNLAAGTSYTIVAAYSGDTLHSPSTSAPVIISGTATNFSLTVTPATVSLAKSQNATLTVTLASSNGFTDTIGLGCASLPAAVTCHFSSPNVDLAANASQTAQLTIDTNNPLGGGETAMIVHPGNRSVSLAGLLLPFSLFFGCVFLRFRRRYAVVLTSALVLLLSGAAMLVTGCAGISQSSATPGTYVIQVVGVGANSDITHYQNVTLTITQ